MGKHEVLVRNWIIEYCCRKICSMILRSQNYKRTKAFEMYRDIVTDLLGKQDLDTLPQTHQIWLVFVELLTRLNDKEFVLEEDGAMFDLLDDIFKYLHEKLLISKIQCIRLITAINQVRMWDNLNKTEKSDEIYASLKKAVNLIAQDFCSQMGPPFLNQVYEIYRESRDVVVNIDEEDGDVSEGFINEENDQEDEVDAVQNVVDDNEHELDAVVNDEDDAEQDLDAVIRRRNTIEDQSTQHVESFRMLDEPEAENTQNEGRGDSPALNRSNYSLRSRAATGKSLSPVTKPDKMLEVEMKGNFKTLKEKSAYDAVEETARECDRRVKRNRRECPYSSQNVARRSSSSDDSDQDELKAQYASRYNLRSIAKSGNILSPVAKPDKKLEAKVGELRRESRERSDYFDEEAVRQVYRRRKMADKRVREWLSQNSTLCSSSTDENDTDRFKKQNKNEKERQTQNEKSVNCAEGWKSTLSKSPHTRRSAERGRSLNPNRLTSEEQSMAPRKRKTGPIDETWGNEPRRTKVMSNPDDTKSAQRTSNPASKPQAPPEEEAASFHDVSGTEGMPAAEASESNEEEDLEDSIFQKAIGQRRSANKKRRPFSSEEVKFLIKGVKRFGVGSWAKILKEYSFNNRSSVQLKDKWRNLLKKYNAK